MSKLQSQKKLMKNGGLWYQIADIQLHIGTENEINKSKRHPAFEVNDLKSARIALEANDISIKEEIQIPGQNRFSFMDPFGNRIEFLEKNNK